MSEKTIQDALGLDSGSTDGPVKCLGQEFESDAARREHYLELLREKMKDPEFRNKPGFPIGDDDDILELSDPPYYTACPNPWVSDFVGFYGRPYTPKSKYHRNPLAADVSEGKKNPLYLAHSYHTKVPHRAVMRYILNYTEPGDIVLDAFCGSGMTGVATAACKSREEVKSLDFHVDTEGRIFDPEGSEVGALGERISIQQDLSPFATFIAKNFSEDWHSAEFGEAASALLDEFDEKWGWLFETEDADGTVYPVNFFVWSEVFFCPECSGDIVFFEDVFDRESKTVRKSFDCNHCGASLTKRRIIRSETSEFDPRLGKVVTDTKRKLCLVNYQHKGKQKERAPSANDIKRLEKLRQLSETPNVPAKRMMFAGDDVDCWGDRWRAGTANFTHTHHLFLDRSNATLGFLWNRACEVKDHKLRHALQFWLDQSIWGFSLLARYVPTHFSQVNQYLSGVYYIGSQAVECSPRYLLERKSKKLEKIFSAGINTASRCISTGSSTVLSLPDSSIDYIFVDPPFGENLNYAELNFLAESFYGVYTNPTEEAIISKFQRKSLSTYGSLMESAFKELYRVLKPGRWITIEFSNTSAGVWNSIQTGLQITGFVVANVAGLDKKHKGFNAIVTPTAVKQDLVISAYKPAGQLELNFSKTSNSPQGVWDFIDYHLTRIPVTSVQAGVLELIAERDPRILFDRMVAFFVSHEVAVPVSSGEFQEQLAERYAERDGMVFLADQVAQYDSARAKLDSIGQMTIFVEDEKSSIIWLRNFLKKRPSISQDIQPEFMQQLSASWKKWESRPELSFLLDQAFLQYKGDGPVPSQIHNYLSTQFKNLRNLGKEDPGLKAKAMDRWYVPDPSKQKDMDELRERKLLGEFWSYLPPNYVPPALSASTGGEDLPGLKFQPSKIPKGKKLKELRTEAIRAGFRFCYQKKDYQTMLVAAQIVPDAVIEEDEQLQMFYDTAVTRSGVEDQ